MAGFGKASVSTPIGQPVTKGEMECGEVGNEQLERQPICPPQRYE